ncbi:MAG: zf-HC2 domain-containing protein [Candidatus Acidiferrales bacterium]
MNHFDEMTLLLYLERQLDDAHSQEVRAHAASCPDCRKLLAALDSEGFWLRESLAAEDESVPAHLISPPERGSAPWGWITALGLAAGGVYTVWNGFIEPWQSQAAQAGFTQGNLLTMLFFSGAFWKGWDAMRSLMEFMAVATLGLVVIWLLRRHFRRATTYAVVMAAVLCALALPRPAAAGELRHGDPSYTLPAGQEIKNDLFVAADRTVIDGDVDGDLIVSSRSVTVNGHVKGDVIALAQSLLVNGTVDGNVRATCETVTVAGVVAKNVMSWSGHVILDPKGKINGSATIGAGDAILDGHIGGDLLAFLGELDINGFIGGSARIQGRRLSIGSGAEIAGPTHFEGRNPAEVASGAKLGSPIVFVQQQRGPDRTSPRYYWHQMLLWGASFVFGLALLLIAPGFFYDVAGACKRVGVTSGLGVLFLLATPLAALFVCFTIVGIPLAFATMFLYFIALYSTQVFVGTWLGEKILGAGVGIGPTLGRLALGLAIIRAIRIIPYWGMLVASVVVVWGLGALVLTLYKYMRPHYAPVAA